VSSLIFPTSLPGLTYDVVRTPMWHTERQVALSGKRSTLAYMRYPLVHFELTFSVLRDDVSPSEIQQIVGLFNEVQGGYDTFLFSDPDFNSVNNAVFATTDGVSTSFQTTAQYGAGGYGYGEAIQNFTSLIPVYFLNRFGIVTGLPEVLTSNAHTLYLLQNTDLTNAVWTKANATAVQVAFGGLVTLGGANLTISNIVESTASNIVHDISQGAATPSTGDYSFSGFFAPSGRSWLFMQMNEGTGGTGVNCYFNVSTGAIGTSIVGAGWTNIRPVIQKVPGENYYKCSFTATKLTGGNITCIVGPALGDTVNVYVGTVGLPTISCWGLQLENLSAASATVVTAGSPITQTDITVSGSGVVTTANVYAGGLQLSWTGSFYYRCAFDEDHLQLSKFMNKWWTIKKLPFTSVRL
jgi:uncharacterized protein YjbI with pentapeptide repeats